MKKMRMLPLLALAALLIGFAACQKEKKGEFTKADSDITLSDVMAESIIGEIGEISDQAYASGIQGMKSTNDDDFRLGNCVTITIDTTVMPQVMIIDFGPTNCLCRDGKYRRGQIIVTFTGRFRAPGTVITHTFNNFFVNDNQVEGTKVRTNMGPNANDYPAFNTVANITITLANNAGVITIQSDHTRTWIEGFNTPRIWFDDVFLITGSGTHTHTNGGGFTKTITNPLRKELTCHHFVSGTIETIPVNRPARILDFGNGVCDNIATVTVNGQTFVIRLR